MQLVKPRSITTREWRIHTDVHNLDRYEWVHSRLKGSVLDIGCGHGICTCLMEPETALGIDVREQSIDVAKQFAELNGFNHVNFQVADAYDLPFEDKSFDTVTLLETLEHLEHPELAVREASRVGNRLIITVPAHNFMTHVKGHINNFTTEEILSMLPHSDFLVREPFLFVCCDLV